LFFAIACNPSGHRQASDENFNALLAESKKHVQHYPDSSLTILRELLSKQWGEEEAANRGKVLNLTGAAYDTKGMYDSAAYYLYEASRLAEKIQDDSLQMSVYTNLGILQFNMKNADEAVKYYRQGLAIAETMKDSIAIANQLNNIGNAYMTLKNDFEAAIPYFRQCVEIAQKVGYIVGVKVAGINLSMMYNETGQPDKAMQEAQKITGMYGHNIYADFTVAQAYQQKGNYGKALELYRELLKKPLNSKEFELAILKDMASACRSLNDLNNAIGYLEQYHAQKDSLHDIRLEKEIHDLKIGYETEKKEIQITDLEKEKWLIFWLSIAGGAVLLLALAVFFFLWWWTVQKKHLAESQKELAEQGKQFAEQQIKQLEQEKQLVATQAVLDGEVRERARLARDLHDSLGSILAAAKYNLLGIRQVSLLGKDDMEHYNKTINLLDESMNEMRCVAHHLMPDALSRFGLKPAVSDFCDTLPTVQFVWYGEESRLDAKLEEVVYRIVHELISNALKHSGASQIFVQIAQEADRIALIVQDNGRGFNPSEANGMGLANIRTRVASFGGILNIDSKADEGTEINIEFQIN
jgi:signal transduction histidine kinase/Tfp pilus assembly protein PilF